MRNETLRERESERGFLRLRKREAGECSGGFQYRKEGMRNLSE